MKSFKGLTALFLFLIGAGCHFEAPKEPSTIELMQKAMESDPKNEQEEKKILESGVNVPIEVQNALLDDNLIKKNDSKKEDRFDLSVSDLAARSFFMGLVDGTNDSMVVHPKVDGNISLSLKNVTIDEVMQAVREVYGYGYEKTDYGYSVLPASLQTRTYQIDFLNVSRQGSTSMQINSSSQSSSSGSSGSGSSGSGSGSSSGSSGSSGSSSNSGSSGSSGSGSSSGSSSSSSDSASAGGVGVSTQFLSDPWKELVNSIKAIIGTEGGRSVIPSPQSGLLVVKAMPIEHKEVAAYLKNAQHSALRQVILEAKVLEVILDDAHQSGINWAGLNQMGNGLITTAQIASSNSGSGVTLLDGLETGVTSNIFQGSTAYQGSSYPSNAFSSAVPDLLRATSAFGTLAGGAGNGMFQAALALNKFDAFISLLATQGNVQVLSSPRISTVNNQKAIIKVGKDKYYATNAASATTTGTATTTASSLTIQPFFSGISLDVTPEISEDGVVTLHIHPNVSTVSQDQVSATLGSAGTTTVPTATTTVRESDSVIRAESGQVVVLGGLMQNDMTESITAVPVLGDIPVVGTLFRTTTQQKTKSELVILLKPTVIRSSKGWQHYMKNMRENFMALDRPFHQGSKTKIFGNLAEKR